MASFRVGSGHCCSAIYALMFLSNIVPSSSAWAQDCPLIKLKTDGTRQNELMIDDVNCAMERLAAAENRIGELENDLKAFRVATGMVSAFDRTNEPYCPNGWTPYIPAGGRFIVGAGDTENKDEHGIRLTPHKVKTDGGEERHKLLEGELPADHLHNQFVDAADINAGLGPREFVIIAGKAASKNFQIRDTQPAGQGEPHNNMPPFVALYYCIKQ
jgi:hypothetical protein